jgi:hypothetical protein
LTILLAILTTQKTSPAKYDKSRWRLFVTVIDFVTGGRISAAKKIAKTDG